MRAKQRRNVSGSGEQEDGFAWRGMTRPCRDIYECARDDIRQAPGIFSDPDRLWNLNSTDVTADFGKMVKVFLCSKSNHGGKDFPSVYYFRVTVQEKQNFHLKDCYVPEYDPPGEEPSILLHSCPDIDLSSWDRDALERS